MRVLRRPAAVLAGVAAVVLAGSGCALLAAVAVPGEERPVVSASPTPAPHVPPPAPIEVAAASLSDAYGGLAFTGSVRVTRSPVPVGVPPPAWPFPDDGSVRTLALAVTSTDTWTAGMSALAADVALTAADGGLPRAGTAVVVGASSPETRWCRDGTTSPVTDGFAVGAGVGGVTTSTCSSSPGTRSPPATWCCGSPGSATGPGRTRPARGTR